MYISAIIVTYQSDLAVLSEIVDIMAKQCHVIIADNSTDPSHSRLIEASLRTENTTYIPMLGNCGIGAAQNRAISLAWESGANAVLLLDDDSIPPIDLIDQLCVSLYELGKDAVVGANAVNNDGREISNARHLPGDLPKCRDMMSSGSLITKDVFERVGPFDESLFIDGVDFDWGWRAHEAGIALHLCRATTLRHRLGIGHVAGLRYPSPIRHYFQYRNILRLLGRRYVPWSWRISQIIKLPTKLLLIAAIMPQKRLRIFYSFAGIQDALLGRNGPWRSHEKEAAR